jgi:ATP-dependent protease ClpP protease subunit
MIRHLSIYGIIGRDTTAQSFADSLKGVAPTDELMIHISSEGGSIWQGVSIYHQLLSHPGRKVGLVEGLCASITSLIYQACDHRQMIEGTAQQIHRPAASILDGETLESTELRQIADKLDYSEEFLMNAYLRRAKVGRDEIHSLMQADSMIYADQALQMGFCDEVVKAGAQMVAQVNLEHFANLLAKIKRNPEGAPAPQKMKGVAMEKLLALLKSKGFTVASAEDLAKDEVLTALGAKLDAFAKFAEVAKVLGLEDTAPLDAFVASLDAMKVPVAQPAEQELNATRQENAKLRVDLMIAQAMSQGLDAHNAKLLDGKSEVYVAQNLKVLKDRGVYGQKVRMVAEARPTGDPASPTLDMPCPPGVTVEDHAAYVAYVDQQVERINMVAHYKSCDSATQAHIIKQHLKGLRKGSHK